MHISTTCTTKNLVYLYAVYAGINQQKRASTGKRNNQTIPNTVMSIAPVESRSLLS